MYQAMQNMREVQAVLLKRGWRSVQAWAVANGFLPVTARRVIYDWWHRTDRLPHGGIGRQIIQALREEKARIGERRAA